MKGAMDANRLPFAVYDCFSSRRFGGNVGGIVFEAGFLSDDEMQNVAREINAPVTGFVTNQDAEVVEIRFFMSGGEIRMCGHVAVGLFIHLANTHAGPNGAFVPSVMRTGSGDVDINLTNGVDDGVIAMIGLSAPTIEPSDVDRAAVARALRVDETVLHSGLPLEIGSTGLRHLFVPVADLATMQMMKPDFAALDKLSHEISASTIVAFSLETADPDNTVHCRDFCPAVGADEVPASGTSNSALAGYLVKHGLVRAGGPGASATILAEQGSEIGRPSLVRSEINLCGDKIDSLWVGGSAVQSAEGFVLV